MVRLMLLLPLGFIRSQLLSWTLLLLVCGIPAAAVVFTAVNVAGVTAVARVTAFSAIPTAVDVPYATFPASLLLLLLQVFLPVLLSLLLESPDAPAVSCAAVGRSVELFLSAPAVARVSAVVEDPAVSAWDTDDAVALLFLNYFKFSFNLSVYRTGKNY
jgi:hypothetical protein